MDNQKIQATGCCEPFDPASWQDKEITWQDKLFVKDHVISFLHMPLNFGQRVVKNMTLIEKANAQAPHQLMLTDEIFILMWREKYRAPRWRKFRVLF